MPGVATLGQLSTTINWLCGGGRIISGGDGWSFPPAPGCSSRATAVETGVASSLVTIAPTSFRSTVNGSTVQLDWLMAPDGVVTFQLEAGSAPTLANLAVFRTPTAATTLQVTNVPNGSYFVRVRGVGSDNVPGPPSNEINVVVGGGGGGGVTGAPGAPTQLARQVVGNQVTLTWVPAGPAATSFQIEAGTSAGLSNIIVFDTGNPAAALVANAPDGLYFVRVRGRNAAGLGPASADRAVGVNRTEPPTQPEVCGDGVDNDGDGAVDEDCAPPQGPSPDPGPGPGPDPGPPPPPPPPPPTCVYTVSRDSVRLEFAGGTFDVGVTTTDPSCVWSATVAVAGNPAFLTLASSGPGKGNGTAKFSVSPNAGNADRGATARITFESGGGGGKDVAVTQDFNDVREVIDLPVVSMPPPPPGTAVVAPPQVSTGPPPRPDARAGPPVDSVTPTGTPAGVGSSTGTVRSFTVQSQTAFQFVSVSVDVPARTSRIEPMTVAATGYFIDLRSSQKVVTISVPVPSDTTEFTLQFAVAVTANTFGPDKPVSVIPDAPLPPPCTFIVSNPSLATFGSTGGTFDVTVTTQDGCVWSAAPVSSPFISVNPGVFGNGTGTARFTVAANTGDSRTGTARIAWPGKSEDRSITQSAAPCSYVVGDPIPSSVGVGGGTFDVAVTARAGCLWSAAPRPASASFVTLESGGSGNGDGTAKFRMAANTTIDSRSGTVRIAWSTDFRDRSVSQISACTFTLTSPDTPKLRLNSSGIGSDPTPNEFDVLVTPSPASCDWTLDTVGTKFATFASGVNHGPGAGTMTFKQHSNVSSKTERTVTVQITTSAGPKTLNFTQTYPVALIKVAWSDVEHSLISDIDLSSVEPGGERVYSGNKTGATSYLECDFKPRVSSGTCLGSEEKIYIDAPAASGPYDVYFNHVGGDPDVSALVTATIETNLHTTKSTFTHPFLPRITTTGENSSKEYCIATVNAVTGAVTPHPVGASCIR